MYCSQLLIINEPFNINDSPSQILLFKATFAVHCMTFLNFHSKSFIITISPTYFLYGENELLWVSMQPSGVFSWENIHSDYLCKSHDHDHQWSVLVMPQSHCPGIYSWMSTNEPFEFVRDFIRGHSSPFLYIRVVFFSCVKGRQVSTKVLNMFKNFV